MSTQTTPITTKTAPRISLDSWAVLISLLAAALIRFGLIHKVPW